MATKVVDLGPVIGPQGPQGIQGVKGDTGPQGTPTTVNGKTGASITLNAADVGAEPAGSAAAVGAELTAHTADVKVHVTAEEHSAINRAAEGGDIDRELAGVIASLSNKATISAPWYDPVAGIGVGDCVRLTPPDGAPDRVYPPAFIKTYYDRNGNINFQISVDDADTGFTLELAKGKAGCGAFIATVTPPVEYDLPLTNGWTHISSDDPLQYGKCGDGRVQLMGIIIAPAGATAGQQIATLPAGYRPVGRKAWLHAFDANTGIDYGVMATPDGPVTLWVKAPPANAALVFPVQSFY